MRNYQTARSLFSFLEFLSWAMVVLGVLAALILANSVSRYAPQGAGIMAALPGVAISFLGVVSAAMVQNWRAGVDSAEYGQQMLKLARDQLEISREALQQGRKQVESFATVAEGTNGGAESAKPSFADAPAVDPETSENAQTREGAIEYKGRTISKEEGQFVFSNMAFGSLEQAQGYIDRLGVNPNAKLDGVTRK